MTTQHHNTTNDNNTSGTAAGAVYTLPPQHPDTFKRGSNSTNNANHTDATTASPYQRAAGKPLGSVFQQVYCPNATHVVTLPAAAVEHMPKSGLHIKRLVLCAHHHSDLLHAVPDAAADTAAAAGASRPRCPKGGRCKYVHARVGVAEMRTMPRTQVHVNNAWRSLDDVEYERFPAGANGGQPVRVRCPDGGATCDAMEPQYMLRTKARLPAADADDKNSATTPNNSNHNHNHSNSVVPLRHCAHYYYGRECILGPDCAFVHAVYIDPRAGKNQRAPPAHLLKARPGGVGDGSGRPPVCEHHQRRRNSDASSDSDGNHHRNASGSALGSPSGRSTASGGSEHCASGRFRHDPYSVASTRRCVRCELFAAAAAAGEAARDADAGVQ